MIPLYTQDQFDNSKGYDKLPCKCLYCNEIFFQTKYIIKLALNPKSKNKNDYCSTICQHNARIKNTTFTACTCTNCGVEIKKQVSASKRHKNHFCSHSCSTIYFNNHKTTGSCRSKLEAWLESQLISLYPSLGIHFNDKKTINSELDIYIPSLNLAFEINGILHYEPIYGVNKLNQTQNNDISKSKACHDAKIDLCIIDTSQQKYVKPSTSQKYLDIIINIINERMLTS